MQTHLVKMKTSQVSEKSSVFFCQISLSNRYFKLHFFIVYLINRIGFGTFGTDTTGNKFNDAIEEIADDLENQHVKEIMGISGFGRKAKTFDIVVSKFTSVQKNLAYFNAMFHVLGANSYRQSKCSKNC